MHVLIYDDQADRRTARWPKKRSGYNKPRATAWGMTCADPTLGSSAAGSIMPHRLKVAGKTFGRLVAPIWDIWPELSFGRFVFSTFTYYRPRYGWILSY